MYKHIIACAALGLVLALAGCGGEDPPAPTAVVGGTPSASARPSGSATVPVTTTRVLTSTTPLTATLASPVAATSPAAAGTAQANALATVDAENAARATQAAEIGAGATAEPPPDAATAIPATEAPVPPGFNSRGLGIAAGAWKQAHPVADGTAGLLYENKYFIQEWATGDHPILNITRVNLEGTPLDLAQAQAEAHAFLPADAVPVKTYMLTVNGAAWTAEEYFSPALVTRYADDPALGAFPWHNRAPGTITIVYSPANQGWGLQAGGPNE